MRRRRRSIARLAGAWLLGVLLLVPLVLSGHHHGPEQAAARHSCSVCTVSHTTFAPATTPVPRAPLGLVRGLAGLVTVDLVVRLEQADHHGRAPPRRLSLGSL